MTRKFLCSNKKKEEPYPLTLSPAYKDYLWGGNKLKKHYYKMSDMSPLAESWECSTHEDGLSTVQNGPLRGYTLKNVLSEYSEWGGGEKTARSGELPILIKLIDAERNLSIQVHPDDEYALRHEGQLGKIEMWYILEAEENAYILYGFINDITKEEVREAIDKNDIMKHLNWVPVKKGDVFYIEPGTLHAIGGGIVLAEVQESSNVTYRVYDYNRRSKSGELRPLDIDKALDVVKLKRSVIKEPRVRVTRHAKGVASEMLCRCAYFQVEKISINAQMPIKEHISMQNAILAVEGSGQILRDDGDIPLEKGQCVFFPKELGEIGFQGNFEFLRVTF